MGCVQRGHFVVVGGVVGGDGEAAGNAWVVPRREMLLPKGTGGDLVGKQ